MAPSKMTPVPRRPFLRPESRSFWSTAVVFIILLIMTVLMGLLLKGLITGSLRPF